MSTGCTLSVALLDERRCEGVNELLGVYAPGGGIDALEIHGPFDATGLAEMPSWQAIFSCNPPSVGDEPPCAREILRRLAARAYRRPVDTDSAELATLLRFYEQGRHDGDFEDGIANAIARILVDPKLLYRLEAELDGGVAPGTTYAVSDLELARRGRCRGWRPLSRGLTSNGQ
jgi:hypothetical protein